MKKIIITSACLFVVFFATAQTGKLVSEPVAANTKAEDPHNPLVNGIPYSQYKAQQQALKQQNTVKQVQMQKPVELTGSLAPVKPVITSVKSGDNTGSVAPQVKKEEAKPIVKTTEKGSTEQ